jgi:hypothetical protein
VAGPVVGKQGGIGWWEDPPAQTGPLQLPLLLKRGHPGEPLGRHPRPTSVRIP